MKKWLGLLLLALGVLSSASCGQQVDLTKALSVTDVFSGWYDFGVVGGMNKLVPSVSFKLQNVSDEPVSRVQMLVSFWQEGADGEKDSKEVTGIGGDAVAPGASSEAILVRSEVGYTLEQPRAELFSHGSFKDFTVKLFAKKGGRLVPIGAYTIERRIIPQATASRLP